MARRDAFHVAPNIAIVRWMRPAADARETDDARQTIVLAFKELAPWSARFEFLCFWNGLKMKPSYDYTLVHAEPVAPVISVAQAEADGDLAAKAGQVRRRWERHRDAYAAIAEAVCRGNRAEAERLHDAILRGAIDTALVAARYLQLHADGERGPVSRIASEYSVNAATVHRRLKAAKASGRWPTLGDCYPRRPGMRVSAAGERG
ncbi:MAG: hypothetical protein M3364_01465 [Actinomycetota bacterium]|nr:hypothetical protein [Actinomycetota bacterium]